MTYTFELSKPLVEYGEMLREWAVREVRPLAREADERHGPPEGYQAVLDTCPVPLGLKDTAGAKRIPEFEDGRRVTRLVFYENLNYGDVWALPTLVGGIGHLVVNSMGTSEQRRRWYEPAEVAGGMMVAFALTEPHFGSDISQVRTTAVRDGSDWVLNGSKIYCSNGAISDYVTVFATVDRSLGARGIAAFVVPRETEGFVVTKPNEEKLGIRSWITSALSFDDCRIPLENRLGWDDAGPVEGDQRVSGPAAALAALSDNRPNMSAMAVGIASASLDTAEDHLRQRRAGFTVARWARIESDLDRMRAALARARRLMLTAQWAADHGGQDRTLPAMAKAYAPPTAERVIRRCIQLLGPDAVSNDLLLEKWYRDIKIMDIFEGSGQIQRLIVARGLIGAAAG